MSKPNIVYLDVWTGDPARAQELVQTRYPDAEIVQLSHRELRDGGWKGQVRVFRTLKGQALVFFLNPSLTRSKQNSSHGSVWCMVVAKRPWLTDPQTGVSIDVTIGCGYFQRPYLA